MKPRASCHHRMKTADYPARLTESDSTEQDMSRRLEKINFKEGGNLKFFMKIAQGWYIAGEDHFFKDLRS